MLTKTANELIGKQAKVISGDYSQCIGFIDQITLRDDTATVRLIVRPPNSAIFVGIDQIDYCHCGEEGGCYLCASALNESSESESASPLPTAGALACTECPYIFTEAELAAEDKKAWGHPCPLDKDLPGMVCESFRKPVSAEVDRAEVAKKIVFSWYCKHAVEIGLNVSVEAWDDLESAIVAAVNAYSGASPDALQDEKLTDAFVFSQYCFYCRTQYHHNKSAHAAEVRDYAARCREYAGKAEEQNEAQKNQGR